MGSTSLDSRVLSSAELRVSGESMEKGVITADVATHEEVTESRELFAGQLFGRSHLARVRACCGLLCAVCEVFEVQVLVVVGSAVRRLRGGSFVCASGVLAVDVAAILRHDSWASAIVCHTSSRRDTRQAGPHNLRLSRPPVCDS